MADVVVMRYRTQALALLHHADGLAPLMRSQLWLGPELDAPFLGSRTPTIGAGQDAGSLVLGQGRQEGEDASPDRGGEIQPLPIERLEGGFPCADRSLQFWSPVRSSPRRLGILTFLNSQPTRNHASWGAKRWPAHAAAA